MNDIRIVSEKLEKLLTDRSVSVYEYTVSESETRELNTEKTDFNLFRTIFGGSVSVTVILDGRKGTASGNDLTDAGLEKAVSDAVLGAESSLKDDANVIAEKQEPETFSAGPLEADMPRLYARLQEMFEGITREYPHVNLLQVIADHERAHRLYANSNGTRFEQFSGAYHVSLEMSGSDGETNTGLDYTQIALHDLEKPFLDQGSMRNHMESVEKSLKSVSVNGKFEGSVIFTPDCVGEFMYMLMGNYMTNTVIMDGTSQWLNRLNEQVASDRITVTLKAEDDRLVDLQPYTSDGYKAENVTPIDHGVLKCFLLNLYAARKTGRPVSRNGGFSMVMEPGDTALNDMIASVKKGLIVGGFSGGEPGANGEFSGVAKNSFLVEDGKIVGAVTETMINGNLEQVFRNVEAVSRELVCDGTSVIPYVMSSGIVVSGK